MARGKSIRIFLADGNVTGIRHGEIVNWTGQALMVPRKRYAELKDWDESSKPGVYFLFGEDDASGEAMAYIGESENVYDRLRSHVDRKEFWNEAVLFTNKDENLTKAHAKYLESRLIQTANKAARYKIENGTAPPLPNLPRGDRDAMDEFFENLRLLLGALGHKLLEPVAEKGMVEGGPDTGTALAITMTRSGLTASGQLTDEGVVVLPGSQATTDVRASLSDGYGKLRQRLIDSGVLSLNGDHYIFTKEYLFSSPSAAAALVCGQACNGREYWKDVVGRTLKQIEEEAV
ncbi:MAG: GIY-YIG nuclease family protein [Chromatiales bacterium]|nr:GIY-YIG nuclease family protein [Chromatiales bacterium]